jgi:hypothetical protein
VGNETGGRCLTSSSILGLALYGMVQEVREGVKQYQAFRAAGDGAEQIPFLFSCVSGPASHI